jgi:type VI protein secretion system component Hcp
VIAQAVATGRHFDEAVLSGPGFTITLKDVVLSSFHTGQPYGGKPPTDSWSLSYGSVEWKATPKPDE